MTTGRQLNLLASDSAHKQAFLGAEPLLDSYFTVHALAKGLSLAFSEAYEFECNSDWGVCIVLSLGPGASDTQDNIGCTVGYLCV